MINLFGRRKTRKARHAVEAHRPTTRVVDQGLQAREREMAANTVRHNPLEIRRALGHWNTTTDPGEHERIAKGMALYVEPLLDELDLLQRELGRERAACREADQIRAAHRGCLRIRSRIEHWVRSARDGQMPDDKVVWYTGRAVDDWKREVPQ